MAHKWTYKQKDQKHTQAKGMHDTKEHPWILGVLKSLLLSAA